MSGHSKWSTIKRDKGINDAKRGAVFSKVTRQITIAAKEGGADPNSNPKLRIAIEKAKESRMPKENIQRAIDRGVGKGEYGNLTEVTYEGFGPNGEAFMVKALTDNTNRTVTEIRTIFSKAGGSLGATNSTAYIFGEDPGNPLFKADVLPPAQEKLSNLYNSLLAHDDVEEVYINFNLA